MQRVIPTATGLAGYNSLCGELGTLREQKFMSVKLAGLLKRLVRLEKIMAETAERERLADCICNLGGYWGPTMVFKSSAFASDADYFEAKMNQTCPVHGFRDLGLIFSISFITPGRSYERCRVDDVLDEYYARRSQYYRAIENASQEA
jgi:hypothetical protein